MQANKKKWIVLAAIFGFIALVWAAKTLYFVSELALSPHKKWILVSSVGVSLIITSILISKTSKWKAIAASVLYALFSLLLYADVVYERYYDSILHIELLSQAGQLGLVKDSIVTLMQPTDIWYVIDLPLIIASFFIAVKIIERQNHRFLALGSSLAGFIIIVLASMSLQPAFSDQFKVARAGLLPAHLYDLSRTVYTAAFAEEVTADPAMMKEMETFFKENQALQKQSPYFGKYKDKNLIIIQAESLNEFPIGLEVEGEEITPNLNNLVGMSHYYPNTYLQIGRGNTSDAEFVVNNSLYPMAKIGVYKAYPQNTYLSLPNVLKEEGYRTSAYHGNEASFWNRRAAYPNQGFDVFYHRDHPLIDSSEMIGLGISDDSLMKQMVDIESKLDGPFYSFFVSITTHRPFVMDPEYEYLTLPANMDGTATGNYLQSVRYFDDALGNFMDYMKEKELWDDTILVVYGDHYGPVPEDAAEIKQFLNVNFADPKEEFFKIPLIIHHPGQTEGIVNTAISSQMDIYPTLTSLLGIEQPLAQMGKPLDIKRDGFVGFAYETTRYTFFSDKMDYNASPDGLFENGACTDPNKKPLDVSACESLYHELKRNIEYSDYLLSNDFIDQLFK